MSTSWKAGIPAPSDDDLNKCVACGLCLPHCPTFRVTGKETASPRGRIAAMRAVSEGRAPVVGDFTVMTDECLSARSYSDVCVPLRFCRCQPRRAATRVAAACVVWCVRCVQHDELCEVCCLVCRMSCALRVVLCAACCVLYGV